RRCGIDALLCRPELARPSRRQAPAPHHAQSLVGIRNPVRHFGGAIAAIVVDQDDRPPAAIVLREQRSDAGADAVRLVARRHHGGAPRPCGELCCAPIVALAAAQKGAAGEQQIEPDRKRNRSNSYHARPPRSPGMAAEPQGPADRVGKNNSTYSMNWARKSWTGGPLLVDCRAVRLRAEWIPVSGPEGALT